MGHTENQSLYDRLNDSQKNGLNAIKSRIHSSGQGPLDSKIGDQVIQILESWLMDDEQKQHLAANVWDIFFLYAASSLLSLTNGDRNKTPATSAPSVISSDTAHIPEPTKTDWLSLDITDGHQTEILELIAKGYLASGNMAEEIAPRVSYDGENFINIQFLAACLRLAMGFNLAAPEAINHLRRLLPAAAANNDLVLDKEGCQYFRTVYLSRRSSTCCRTAPANTSSAGLIWSVMRNAN